MGREISFSFSGYSGWDAWRNILPKSWQTSDVALSLIRDLKKGSSVPLDFVETPVFIVMPWGCYRILDEKPTLKPAARGRAPGA